MKIVWYFLMILSLIFGSYSTGQDIYIEHINEQDKEISIDIDEPEKPAIERVALIGDVDGCDITNTYHIDYMSNGVVGQEGVPIKVELPRTKEDEFLMLVFCYDEDKLGCDEGSLGILYYDVENQWYDTVESSVDRENNQVKVVVEKEGTYILEDMGTWVAVWTGNYDYEDENTMKEPECHWHDVFYYEDIEALADTSIYDGSEEYHITNINELAGLVKLVNEGEDFLGCVFYLESDIDLSGYNWVPIGWSYPADNGYYGKDFPFDGVFYGNGHIISNAYISYPDWSNIGFFGRTTHGFEVHDLNIIDCYIEGRYYVGGLIGDNINQGITCDVTNCIVTGIVKGASTFGAILGSSAYMRVENCYAIMEEGGADVLCGDLRGGETINCHLNDEKASEALTLIYQETGSASEKNNSQ